MTASPSFLSAIAEVCVWHGRLLGRHPLRPLKSGGHQEILPPEIPQAIRNGEIAVPEEMKAHIINVVLDMDIDDYPDGVDVP